MLFNHYVNLMELNMKVKMIFLILFTITSHVIFTQDYTSDYTPQRIILNLTEKPETSIAVTWRTLAELESPLLQFAEATVWRDFKDNSTTVIPAKEIYKPETSIISFSYSVIIDELKPKTTYVYRVGSENEWSEWNQFTTASEEIDRFKFVYFGDPQNSIKEHCSRVFRKAHQTVPDAAFWLFAGDMAGDPTDSLWNDLFYAGGHIFRITPSILTPGNHDHPSYIENGKKRRDKEVGPTWKTHLTLPENGVKELPETCYFIDYQGVRFVSLNSYTKLDQQAEWLDSILTNNSNNWTIVTFHHPFYSSGRERDSKETREAFQGVFDKHKVDLVLTGHDHTYARSKKLRNGKPVPNNETGTVYVVSVSGPKSYAVNPQYRDLMEKMGNEVQLFQEIEINKNKLRFKAYTVLGDLYDSFELIR